MRQRPKQGVANQSSHASLGCFVSALCLHPFPGLSVCACFESACCVSALRLHPFVWRVLSAFSHGYAAVVRMACETCCWYSDCAVVLLFSARMWVRTSPLATAQLGCPHLKGCLKRVQALLLWCRCCIAHACMLQGAARSIHLLPDVYIAVFCMEIGLCHLKAQAKDRPIWFGHMVWACMLRLPCLDFPFLPFVLSQRVPMWACCAGHIACVLGASQFAPNRNGVHMLILLRW